MPLKNLKVIDFTYLLPGPLATLLLADLGATVLKVESPTRIDLVRLLPPFVDKEGAISGAHAYLNRNKHLLALDLKKPAGTAIIERLIRDQGYDILVEQFRPGVMARLGLSYERLRQINPALIYCSLTGYGQSGPLKDRAGHDINYLSLAGVMGYSGTKAGGPALMGIQVADVTGSFNAVIGLLAAVVHRQHTGEGQQVDVAMTDCLYPFHALAGTRRLCGDAEPGFESDALGGGSLYGFYQTADGGYLSFGGVEEQFAHAFFEALGLPDLADGGVLQFHNLPAARARVQAVIRSQPLAYWVERFKVVDACVEPVLPFSGAAEGEHARARGLIVDVPGPDGTTIKQIACPLKFSGVSPEYRWAGGALGRDTRATLGGLGFSVPEIEALYAEGVIGKHD